MSAETPPTAEKPPDPCDPPPGPGRTADPRLVAFQFGRLYNRLCFLGQQHQLSEDVGWLFQTTRSVANDLYLKVGDFSSDYIRGWRPTFRCLLDEWCTSDPDRWRNLEATLDRNRDESNGEDDRREVNGFLPQDLASDADFATRQTVFCRWVRAIQRDDLYLIWQRIRTSLDPASLRMFELGVYLDKAVHPWDIWERMFRGRPEHTSEAASLPGTGRPGEPDRRIRWRPYPALQVFDCYCERPDDLWHRELSQRWEQAGLPLGALPSRPEGSPDAAQAKEVVCETGEIPVFRVAHEPTAEWIDSIAREIHRLLGASPQPPPS